MKNKKEYTQEETEKFKFERQIKLKEEKLKRKNPELIWDSKKQGTFKGSAKELHNIKSE